ncbi:MAG: UDP-N-acetylglucosamine 2-epimerase (non-hydrolyzing) [Candidatus Omnitrophota bacterium]
MKIINVVGARPNFMKIAPIIEEMKKHKDIKALLLHTGQHYDREMSKLFFEDLKLPAPDIYLGVGSASHAQQTAKIMLEFEKILLEEKPDLVVVVGDVNSTIACALTAVKLFIPVAHVEAGLRSYDRTMPEEINRILTDSISDYLFTTCRDADKNLLKEGIAKEKIHFVGNVMIDTLLKQINKASESDILDKLNLQPKGYTVLTLHRPSNVDNKETFTEILDALEEVQKRIKIIFPIHPRTAKKIEDFGLSGKVEKMSNFNMVPPMGYLDFLKLMSESKFILTDSGGIQEETTILKIPCITLRENTERPITIIEGTNVLVGTDKNKIVEESLKIIEGKEKRGTIPELWDGKAAERIVGVLRKK